MSFRAAPLPFASATDYALGLHLARAADVAAAENCRTAAEMLVAAVYAAFSAEVEADLICQDVVIAA